MKLAPFALSARNIPPIEPQPLLPINRQSKERIAVDSFWLLGVQLALACGWLELPKTALKSRF
jgi:hypothetical protein